MALLRASGVLIGHHPRSFSTSSNLLDKLKIAIIGQSLFGAEVYRGLQHRGHKVVGVFTVPDVNGKPDPLVLAAMEGGSPVFKYTRWRHKGQIIKDILAEYQSVGADLNVLPFCSQFIPMEVINHPKRHSIIYHPSLLPRHRGASAINWTLINGDAKAGFTIFWADDGLDTGPILLQRECAVEVNDTVDSLYNRFLYPKGVKAMLNAVDLIELNQAPWIVQSEEGASYEPIMKRDQAEINWDQPGLTLHNFIRGNDKVPGAWTLLDDQKVTLYGSTIWEAGVPSTTDRRPVSVKGLDQKAFIHSEGLVLTGNDGEMVILSHGDKNKDLVLKINITQLKFEESGKIIPANKYGLEEEVIDLGILSKEERDIKKCVRLKWMEILALTAVDDDTDFFHAGAGSMDVTRLVEGLREHCKVMICNEDVYMATRLKDFITMVIMKNRNGTTSEFKYDAIKMTANEMELTIPHQLFINNKFVDSENGETFKTINPTNEEVICEVSLGTPNDVNKAVEAAKKAFDTGEWGRMNARDRGALLYRLADLMEENKCQLSTLESLDSGAVYTMALKTHIGMSIETFRYMAGWCDKLEGSVIPLNHARPNRNLSFTRKEPIGVCGIITPWNYPLMMLAWKSAACLAAGNTLVLKPAQVTPLTSLKFCELVAKAGIPPGVFNVITGSGSVVGQAIADHPDVRKLGFTGSTPIGKTIMESCSKSNLKKVSLELGGKSPFVVFADYDLDKAAKLICNSVFFNKGENCIAAGRIFIQDSVHDALLTHIVAEVAKMRVGDPLDRSTDHGPQNHKAHLDKLLEYCQTGLAEGATLVLGGNKVDRKGFYMEPTVFTDVQDDMVIAKEESFGPIMVISKFETVDEVVQRANATEFGLAAGVLTNNLSRALRMAERLDAGTVFVNTYNKTDVAAPFGGFKQSGFGKDLGAEALNEYLKTKTVTVEF